jgi:MFS family permease
MGAEQVVARDGMSPRSRGRSGLRGHPFFRWLLLANMVTIMFSSYFIRLAWSNVSASASQTLGSTAYQLGLFVTLFYIGYVPANALGGILIDRFGSRRVLVTALGLLAGATAGFGLIESAAQGLFVQTLMGISSGSFYAATIKVTSPWFTKRERGFAFGFLAMAGPLAIVAANLVFPLLIDQVGWSHLYRGLGIYAAALAILTFFVTPAEAPSEDGTRPELGISHVDEHGGAYFAVRLLLVCLAGFGASWGTYGFTFCSNLLLVKSHAFGAEKAATVVVMFGLGGTLAIPIYGLLSDRVAAYRPQLVMGLLIFPLVLAIFGSRTSFTGFCVAGFVLGVSAFAFWPLISAVLADQVDHRRLGFSAGLANACWQSANVLVPLAAGAIVDATHSLAMSLLVLAVGPLVGVACLAALIRVTRIARAGSTA